jgi:drug/metabolite transporter (DMT)-like permease
MLGFALSSGRKHPEGGIKGFFAPLVIFALLGTIINQGTFLMGLKYTTSTNSAILNTLIPVFTLMLVTIRGQEPLTLNRILGFIAAFAGVLVVRKVENFSLSDQTAIGDLLTIVNCLSYAFFLSFGKKFMGKHDPIWTTTYLFFYGTIGLGLMAASLNQWSGFQMPLMTPKLWGAVVFAILGSTLLTYFLNFWALAHANSSHVALFIYLQPVVASLIAWVFMGEEITVRTVLASGSIFLGMILAMRKSGWGSNAIHVIRKPEA